jgi:hypothetical protein
MSKKTRRRLDPRLKAISSDTARLLSATVTVRPN